MISNQILQSTLDGLKKITRVDMCVVDTEGVMLASTFGEEVDFRDVVVSFENSPAESQVISNYQFFKVLDEGHLEYVLIASGNSDDVYTTGKLTAFQLQCLLFILIQNRGGLSIFWNRRETERLPALRKSADCWAQGQGISSRRLTRKVSSS